MKKFACIFSAVALMCGLVGCTSVDVVKGPSLNGQKFTAGRETIAHLNIQNSGIFLFSIPLFAGSTDSVGHITCFKDTVTANNVAEVMGREARNLGGREVIAANTQYSEFGFIFYSRSINMSGNVVK